MRMATDIYSLFNCSYSICSTDDTVSKSYTDSLIKPHDRWWVREEKSGIKLWMYQLGISIVIWFKPEDGYFKSSAKWSSVKTIIANKVVVSCWSRWFDRLIANQYRLLWAGINSVVAIQEGFSRRNSTSSHTSVCSTQNLSIGENHLKTTIENFDAPASSVPSNYSAIDCNVMGEWDLEVRHSCIFKSCLSICI